MPQTWTGCCDALSLAVDRPDVNLAIRETGEELPCETGCTEPVLQRQ